MNEYFYEMDSEINLDEFAKWLNAHIGTFHKNMKHKETGTKKLRTWVKWFLDWSEYKDNGRFNG